MYKIIFTNNLFFKNISPWLWRFNVYCRSLRHSPKIVAHSFFDELIEKHNHRILLAVMSYSKQNERFVYKIKSQSSCKIMHWNKKVLPIIYQTERNPLIQRTVKFTQKLHQKDCYSAIHPSSKKVFSVYFKWRETVIYHFNCIWVWSNRILGYQTNLLYFKEKDVDLFF